MAKQKSNRREFLQLANTYKPLKDKIAGFFISEKLDGKRCLWDGGITRGVPTIHVPWAGILDPKTGERKDKIKPYATGLWTRYGNPICAPDWFLNSLPACPLDGELWAGRGNFQLVCSICSGDTPDPRFDQIQFCVYSSPSLDYLLSTGEIKNANMLASFDWKKMHEFLNPRLMNFSGFCHLGTGTFQEELNFLEEFVETQSDRCFIHKQVKLPMDEDDAKAYAEEFLTKVLDQRGEGIILRDPHGVWTPKRHKSILKYKPFEDAEAEIIGFRAGKEGKIGQALGKIGTLLVRSTSLEIQVEFEIGSGLTLDQRRLGNCQAGEWAFDNPGEILPKSFDKSEHFKVGDIITFKYRELTDDLIPKEARFWRLRASE